MEPLPGTLEFHATAPELVAWDTLQNILVADEGTLGFKLPSVGVRDKIDIPSFVVVSRHCGIILIDIIGDEVTGLSEDEEYMTLLNGEDIYSRSIVLDNFCSDIKNRLRRNREVFDRKTEDWKISITNILVFSQNNDVDDIGDISEIDQNIIYGNQWENSLSAKISDIHDDTGYPDDFIDIVISIIEGTETLSGKSKSRRIIDPETKNDFIQISLAHTFKLDRIQRKISLQIPSGPQRIRGLAGTGKTVILSLKAALAHQNFPEYKILFLFNTHSMYAQIRKRISNYYVAETKSTIDTDRVKIFHAWGGRAREGFYSYVCKKYGIRPLTFSDVRNNRDPLDSIFADLLDKIGDKMRPEFDLVLIDEAQDFGPAFFETVFKLTGDNKRIVWAYDEFQSMKDIHLPPPSGLFGNDVNGQPNMPDDVLDGSYAGGIEKDFILPNSYRNPRVGLTAAHSIALGLYRKGGAIDAIDSQADWEALGYSVINPKHKAKFEANDEIVIERRIENSRNILEGLLRESNHDDKELFELKSFANKQEEFDWVSDEIVNLVETEGVQPEDIIVVTVDPRRSRTELALLRSCLDARGVSAITPGFVEDAASFQEVGCVTLATPYRAKGNEANVVFVISTEVVARGVTFRERNSAFMALTRSRGWTYVTGIGGLAGELNEELERVLSDYPELRFVYPDEDTLQRRRNILLENDDEIEKASDTINELLEHKEDLLIEMIRANPDILKKIRGDAEDDNS
jgi:superfamily I DNA and RNA helicase